MWSKLTTQTVHTTAEVKAFFNRCARTYSKQHGPPDHLLNYRIRLIKQSIAIRASDVLLDIGCGNGHHLFALSEDLGRGIGIDLSFEMIAVAKEHLQTSLLRKKITFQVDNAEELLTISDQSVDVVICIGALEHMLKKSAVLTNVYRVLKPNGRFLCLTPNGSYLWYQFIAPLLGVDTKHLSTDKFLTLTEIERLLVQSGFTRVQPGNWTFIPKGDISPVLGALLQALDGVGKRLNINRLRGGLKVCAWKST